MSLNPHSDYWYSDRASLPAEQFTTDLSMLTWLESSPVQEEQCWWLIQPRLLSEPTGDTTSCPTWHQSPCWHWFLVRVPNHPTLHCPPGPYSSYNPSWNRSLENESPTLLCWRPWDRLDPYICGAAHSLVSSKPRELSVSLYPLVLGPT